MSEVGLALPVAILAGLLALAAVLYALHLRRQFDRTVGESRETEQALRTQLELVRQSISGLTAGTVGMDRRMQRLESRERLLTERQETYENQQVDDQPYGQAIRLVQQGASEIRLVDELGLGKGEAELIVRLHGHRDSA